MFTYSRSSILFFKPVLIICCLLGLIPPYDFNKRKLIYRQTYLLYVLLLMVALLYFLYVWFEERYKEFANKDLVLITAFDFIITGLGCVTFLSISIYSLKNDFRWEELLQRFAYLECVIYLSTENKKEHILLKNAFCQTILGVTFLIVTCIFYFLFYYDVFDLSDGFRVISLSYNFVICTMMIHISMAVKYKFFDINQMLNTCRHAQFYNAINIIRKCRYIYQEMAAIVEIVNDIFGRAIFLMYFLYGVQTLEISTIMFINMKKEVKYRRGSNYMAVVLLNISFLSIPVLTTMCCDYAKRAAEKLVTTCHQLQRPLDMFSKRYQELQDFIDQVICRTISFNAFRCFEVDRKATLMLWSVTSNYFIVMVQFLNK